MSPRATLPAVASLLIAACASTPEPWDPKVMQYDGAELFATYCSSCHGASGEGNKTLATSMLSFTVPDLTLVAYRAGGTFPRDDVRKIITGTSPSQNHTSRTMPIWAWQFYNAKSNDVAAEQARAAVLIDRLVDHVATLQRDPGDRAP